MNKLLPIICLFVWSCSNTSKLKKDLAELCLNPIEIPTDLIIDYNGIDSLIDIFSDVDLKYIVYTDSVSCSSCYINKMYLWQPFLEYSATFGGRLRFYFIFRPSKGGNEAVRIALQNSSMDYPVLIDEKGEFERLNSHLPKNKQLHAFLLDENNSVVLVGNPLNNKEVEKMFYQKTQELLRK